MDRFLVWYIDKAIEYAGKAQVRETYITDLDYKPVKVWLYAKTPPTGSPLKIDINNAGTSLFVDNPQLVPGQTLTMKTTFQSYAGPSQQVDSGTAITLDIDAVGSGEPGRDITVVLQLRAKEKSDN